MVRDAKVVGRQRKGTGAFFEEEAANFDKDEDEAEMPQRRAKRKADNPEGEAAEEGGSESEDAEGADIGEESDDDDQEKERTEYEKESGITLEPFNMKDEREQGYQIKKDRGGLCYVENPKAQREDGWLDEYDEKWSKDVQAAKWKKPRKGKEVASAPIDLDALKRQVVAFLDPGENVLRALKRFRGTGKQSEEGMTKFNELTELADKLLAGGYTNVYADPKEKILERLQSTVEWEYKLNSCDGESFGPFNTTQMLQWGEAGNFAETDMWVRQCGATGAAGSFQQTNGRDLPEFIRDTLAA